MVVDAETQPAAEALGTRPRLRAGSWARVVAWGLFLALGFLVLFLRRPETLLRAEFYTEDGQVFYLGTFFGSPLQQLSRPYNGFLHVGTRLVADLSRLVPTETAPLVTSGIALVVVVLCAAYLVSPRMSAVVPDGRVRLVLGLLLLLLPGSQETLGSMTYIQFYGAIFLICLLISTRPRERVPRWLELGVAGIAGLTGPFSILYSPIFVLRWSRTHERWDAEKALVIVATGVIQSLTLLLAADRVPGTASDPGGLVAVALVRGVDVPLLGEFWSAGLSRIGVDPWVVAVFTVSVLVGLAIVAKSFLSRQMLGLATYVWLVIIVGTLAVHPFPVIRLLDDPYYESRYFLVPGAMVAAIVFAGVLRARGRLGIAALLLCGVLVVGVAGDFRLIPRPDHSWAVASRCIGGPSPCLVAVEPANVWTIRWPGAGGTYVQGPMP